MRRTRLSPRRLAMSFSGGVPPVLDFRDLLHTSGTCSSSNSPPSRGQFTGGHTITVSNGSVTTSCLAGTGLPGDTGGRKMLFGTAGLSSAFGVTPDYVCPDFFVLPNGGFINWGEGSNTLTYPALPTDGRTSLNRQGFDNLVTGPATPQNFAGVIGTAPVATTPAYQGMWWAGAPESGWGINTAHQGDILFATGLPTARTATASGSSSQALCGTSTGATSSLVRGPPFNAVPFDPARSATNVGNDLRSRVPLPARLIHGERHLADQADHLLVLAHPNRTAGARRAPSPTSRTLVPPGGSSRAGVQHHTKDRCSSLVHHDALTGKGRGRHAWRSAA